MSVSQKSRAAVLPIAASLGYEIVDVEYVTRDGSNHLIFYIDKPSGITLDDCELFSNSIDALLDEIDPTDGKPYSLDVSSPGLDREFATDRDFERNYNRDVEVRLKVHINKRDTLEGRLIAKTPQSILIEVDGKELEVEMDKIFFVRPLVKFG